MTAAVTTPGAAAERGCGTELIVTWPALGSPLSMAGAQLWLLTAAVIDSGS